MFCLKEGGYKFSNIYLNYPQAKGLWDSDFFKECLHASLTHSPSVYSTVPADILEAKDTICSEYEEACNKKFEEEIKTFINTNFQEQKPEIGDNIVCTLSYNGVLMLVHPMCCDGGMEY